MVEQKNASVLIVDDRPNWRQALSSVLEEDYLVKAVATYSEAVEALLSQDPPFDVAVIDIRLEDEDETNVQGLELIGYIREVGISTSPIVLTGYPSPQTTKTALRDLGVHGYLDKSSFDISEFREAVLGAVHRTGRTGPTIHKLPPWIFGMHDPGSWRDIFDGEGKLGWVMFNQVVDEQSAVKSNPEIESWARDGYGVLVRLVNAPPNLDSEGHGSIPLPDHYESFAQRCAQFVKNSSGCHIWFVGDEMNTEWNWPSHNHSSEHLGFEPITPEQYAQCFDQVRRAIRKVQSDAWVVPSGLNPLKEPKVQHKDALKWFQAMLECISGLDALDIHTYFPLIDQVRGTTLGTWPAGYNLSAIRDLLRDTFHPEDMSLFFQTHSDPKLRPIFFDFGPRFSFNEMISTVIDYCQKHQLFTDLLKAIKDHNPRQYARYEDRLVDLQSSPPSASHPENGFYRFDEFMATIPNNMRDLPIFLTRLTPPKNWPEPSDGWMQRAFAEVHRWNCNHTDRLVYAALPYRWQGTRPDGSSDPWNLAEKPSYRADLRHALENEYRWQSEPKEKLSERISLAKVLQSISLVRSSPFVLTTDAIVVPTNDWISLEGQVDGHLLDQMSETSLLEVKAMAPVPLKTAIATSAGKLDTKHIIFAVVSEERRLPSPEVLVGAVEAALTLADRLSDVHHLVLPSLDLGGTESADSEARKRVLQAIVAHLRQGGRLQRITFALDDEESYHAYLASLEELQRELGWTPDKPSYFRQLQEVTQALDARDLDRALEITETIEDTQAEADALGKVTQALTQIEDKGTVESLASRASKAISQIEDEPAKGQMIGRIALALAGVGAFGLALAKISEIDIGKQKETRETADLADTLYKLGEIAAEKEAYNEAHSFFEQSLKLYENLEDRNNVSRVKKALSRLPSEVAPGKPISNVQAVGSLSEAPFEEVLINCRNALRARSTNAKLEALSTLNAEILSTRWSREQRIQLIELLWEAFLAVRYRYKEARSELLAQLQVLSREYADLVRRSLGINANIQEQVTLTLGDSQIQSSDRDLLRRILEQIEIPVPDTVSTQIGTTEVSKQPFFEADSTERVKIVREIAWKQVIKEIERPQHRVTTRTLDIHLTPTVSERVNEIEGQKIADQEVQYQVVLTLLEQSSDQPQKRYFEGALRLDLGNKPRGHVYGDALHRALFHDDIPDNRDRLLRGEPGNQTLKTGYTWAMGRRAPMDDTLRLQLRINTQAARLHDHLWEYLWDPQGNGGGPLACWDRTPFARVLHVSSDTDTGLPHISNQTPLRLLAAIASPSELEYPHETRREELRGVPPLDQAHLKVLAQGLLRAGNRIQPLRGENLLPHASLDELRRRLQLAAESGRPFHVLHLICHGLVNEVNGKAYLVLEREDSNRADLVPESKFAEMIGQFLRGANSQPGLQLVVFASCWTAKQTGEQPLQGIARRLVADAQVPAVIAMQHQLEFEAAQHFSQRLYAQLVHHGEIDRAANAGRRELFDRRQEKADDRPGRVGPKQWGVPVLFMRHADGRLFRIDEGQDHDFVNPNIQTQAVPYMEAPGSDPRRMAKGLLHTIADQLDIPVNSEMLTRSASQIVDQVRETEPAPAPRSHHLFQQADQGDQRMALVRAASRHRRTEGRRVVLFLRNLARAKIAAFVTHHDLEAMAHDGVPEIFLTRFQTDICSAGHVTWRQQECSEIRGGGPSETLPDEHILRTMPVEWRTAYRGFESETGHDVEELLDITGNITWEEVTKELADNELMHFLEELHLLLDGEHDVWSKFRELTMDQGKEIQQTLERIASLLLHAVYPQRFVPYDGYLANIVLEELDLKGEPRYRNGFRGYCALATDLLADDDLGFDDMADVGYFLQRLAAHTTELDAPTELPRDLRIRLQPVRLQAQAIDTDLVLRRGAIERAVAALNAGQHVILIGPPGTGKTTLAEDLCRYAHDQDSNHGHLLVTATADWTTFDTIGGYMPEQDQRLTFRPGLFLEAIETRKWLVIDEINRADIDKAFGELFTVLSGQAVTLPYKERDLPVRIVPPGCPSSTVAHNYVMHPSWRIIGTMNVYDKASLFAMSYAFMRRFAFVDIALPTNAAYQRLIQHFLQQEGMPFDAHPVPETLYRLFDREQSENYLMRWRALGPAIAKDLVRYLHHRVDGKPQDLAQEHLAEALALYVAPQFEGLERDQILRIHSQMKRLFAVEQATERYDRLHNKSQASEAGEGDITDEERVSLEQVGTLLRCVEMLLERIQDLFPFIRSEEWHRS